MRPSSRVAVLAVALVPLGTVAGHVAGYLFAGQPAGLDGSHSYLRGAAWLTAAGAIAALGWVAGSRDLRPARVPAGWLACGQAILFVALESAEHLARGHSLGHLLSEPGLRWGLVAQVATAAALVLATVLAKASGERVRALLSKPRPGVRVAGVRRPIGSTVVRSLTLASSASERGPPRILVSV